MTASPTRQRFVGGARAADERPSLEARRAIMLHMAQVERLTNQEIGDAFGVSRERVRQIIGNRGRVARTKGVDPIKVLATARRARSLHHTARQLKCPDVTVRRCLEALGVLPALHRLWRWRRRWQTVQPHLATARVLAGQLGRTPTAHELVGARVNIVALMRHFGSLAAALQSIGLTPRHRGERVIAAMTCRNGHPRTPASTGRRKNGHQYCRVCARERVASVRQKLAVR